MKLIDIGALYDPFSNLLRLYMPTDDSHGDMLIDLLQQDHQIFNDELHGSGEAARLLEDIMDSGWDDDSGEPRTDPHELYQHRSSVWYHTTMAQSWEGFCRDVKRHHNREPDFPELFDEELARLEMELPSGTLLHRARLGFTTDENGRLQPFQGAEIGAPPPDKATPGRANVEGEVVLYVADQEATAVAEVRPWRGLLVSVAEMRLTHDLCVVDLTKASPPTNPFTDEAPMYEEELEQLLLAFGEELGRPLRRADDPTDYLPCQKLVRRIRKSGFYDGIRYPSALSPGKGTNLVFFDPKVMRIGASKLVEAKRVKVTYGPPEDDEEI